MGLGGAGIWLEVDGSVLLGGAGRGGKYYGRGEKGGSIEIFLAAS